MFTWISRASGLALIGMVAGCQMKPGSFASAGKSPVISVLDGAIKVAAPAGYCVDKQSLQQDANGAVVLIGRCSGASNLAAAVISVTIGQAGSAGVVADGGAAMAAFFQTETGLAALSRAGRADTVQIVQSSIGDAALTLRINEAGVGDYWRAIAGVSGRLVTVSVQAPNEAALDPAKGRKLLGASLVAMRNANGRS